MSPRTATALKTSLTLYESYKIEFQIDDSRLDLRSEDEENFESLSNFRKRLTFGNFCFQSFCELVDEKFSPNDLNRVLTFSFFCVKTKK